jgi:lipopolysaccharide/colanic/teichoic acid biosynthesis glycosyltransferase
MIESLHRILVASARGPSEGALVKRALDIAISLVALVLLAPVLGLIALAIRRDSPGPVVYRGPRVGKDGRIFQILKFRTMYEAPASYAGPRVTARDDTRVTPLGSWLRATKLNELPQFWNVLRGDMSLVGPRPEDPALAAAWPVPLRDVILSLRPGITSPASILYRDEEQMLCAENLFRKYVDELTPDKSRLDQLYVRHRCLSLDVDIMLWTALILLPKIRSRRLPEQFLFLGPATRLIHRYMTWFVADLLVAIVAFVGAGLLWYQSGEAVPDIARLVGHAIMFACLFSGAGTIFRINRIIWSRAASDDVWAIFATWLAVTVLSGAANVFACTMPLGLSFIAALGSLGGFVVVRYRSRLLTGLVSRVVVRRSRGSQACRRVLIVGSGASAQYVAAILSRPENCATYRAAGFVDDNLSVQGMRVRGTDVLGTIRDIPDLICKYGISTVVLADHSLSRVQRGAVLEACQRTGTKFALMPDVASCLAEEQPATPEAAPIYVQLEADRYADLADALIGGTAPEAIAVQQAGRAEVV